LIVGRERGRELFGYHLQAHTKLTPLANGWLVVPLAEGPSPDAKEDAAVLAALKGKARGARRP
jgi:hypothetical protein